MSTARLLPVQGRPLLMRGFKSLLQSPAEEQDPRLSWRERSIFLEVNKTFQKWMTFFYKPKRSHNKNVNDGSLHESELRSISKKMENNKKHWVEELFSPRFSAEDFLHESFEPELLISEKQAKERARKVEGIYKTAMCEFREKEKKKKRELLSKMIIQEPSVQEQAVPAQHATCESCHKADNDSATTSKSSGHCIWNEKELNLLRAEMNKKHSEGAHFNLQLSACKFEISELKATQKKTERELEALKMALAASKRANECKSVLINQLKHEGEKKEADLQSLRKDLNKKCAMVQDLTTSLSKAREEIHHLQLQKADLQQELNTLQQQEELKFLITSEKTKLKYDAQIKKLLREIETLKEERQIERDQYEQDVAELDFLRKFYINEK